MSKEMQIRSVTVELLRPGPAHNQLLSPLTQYLGICDDSEASIVTQPYEHAGFLRRMAAMRYADDGQQVDRQYVLRELGIEMAKVLGSIPRLPGALTADPGGKDTLIHLRLVLSASELAALPFELAKVPVGPNAHSESWLVLQARVPVVITRRTRNVSASGVKWPTKPRILFISADPASVPYPQHRDALVAAMQPFMFPGKDALVTSADGQREQYGKHLTILINPSFDDVVAECAAENYTHIHLLAHGRGERNSIGYSAYGLVLQDTLITADRLASAFTCLVGDAVHRPSVVTLATCDSGNVASVEEAGASMAHVLHQAGVALVVASQVPLSKEGSVQVFSELYSRLVWGESPWIVLHRIRTSLHGRLSARSHDWASLVVYEALPADLDDQLEQTRYVQGKVANDAAFEAIDLSELEPANYTRWRDLMLSRLNRLPDDGRYAMECRGLHASSMKRLAQAEFRMAARANAVPSEDSLIKSCHYLDRALHDYEQAVTGFMVDHGRAVQRMASLHWVLVQQLCLSAVLWKEAPEGAMETATMAARAYLEHPNLTQQAWAHGSLAELGLLKLNALAENRGVGEAAYNRIRNDTRCHVKELVRLARRLNDVSIIVSTRKQFARYVDWWGNVHFERVVVKLDLDDFYSKDSGDAPKIGKKSTWDEIGLLDIAQEMIELMSAGGMGDQAPPGAFRSTAAAATATTTGTATATDPITPSALAAERSRARPAGEHSATQPPETLGAVVVAASSSAATAAAPAPRQQVDPTPAPPPAAATPPKPARAAARKTITAPQPSSAFLTLDMLPAGHGDCLWLEYGHGAAGSGGGSGSRSGDRFRVLIDCGTQSTYQQALKPRLQAQPAGQRAFELFVLSHIDDDHIGGGLPLLAEAESLGLRFDDIWFNGWKHIEAFKPAPGMLGAMQGEKFSELIAKHRFTCNGWQNGLAIVMPDTGALPTHTLPGGLRLTLLSPSPAKLARLASKWETDIEKTGGVPGSGDFLGDGQSDDASARGTGSTDVPALADAAFDADAAVHNGSSIALLAEFEGKRVLLGADAHAPLLVTAIQRLVKPGQRLKLDAFKLPHHGSQNNLNIELMQLLDCPHYLVSSDGSRFMHPDRQAIGRVIQHGRSGDAGDKQPTLHFNYLSKFTQVWNDPALQARYGYATVFPSAAQGGLVVRL